MENAFYFKRGVPTLVTDANGNTVLVGADQSIQFADVNLVAYDTVHQPATVDWMNIRSTGEWDDLVIDSPYSPAHILHPSLCHIKGSFAGYRYWMVYTPYADSDSSYENPCIAASNDFVTWAYPATNPIVPDPGGTNYNSDVDIYFDAVNRQLVVLFREVIGSTLNLKITTSVDGVAWSTPTTIYTGANVGGASATDIVSPSIWYNDTSSKWEIVGVQAKDAGSAWPVVKITSSALLSGWDTSATWTVLTATPPSGRKWWHAQFRRLSGGAVIGIAQDNSGTPGTPGQLYALCSNDEATFAYRHIDTNAVKEWYGKPTFLLIQDQVSGKYAVCVVAGKLTEARLYKQTMQLDTEAFALDRVGPTSSIMYGAALGNARGILLADSFNRADDATGLGTSTSGHTYTQTSSAPQVVGVGSNQAYPVQITGSCQAYANLGVANCIAKMTITQITAGEVWLLLRFVDTSNKIRVGKSAGSALTYQVITAGAFAVNETLNITPVATDEIKVSVLGNQFKIYLNDKLIATRFSNQGLTSTNFGVGMNGSGAKIDNLAFISIT